MIASWQRGVLCHIVNAGTSLTSSEAKVLVAAGITTGPHSLTDYVRVRNTARVVLQILKGEVTFDTPDALIHLLCDLDLGGPPIGM